MAVRGGILLLLFSMAALLACAGGEAPARVAAADVDGRDIYDRNCRLCHGEDGKLGLNQAKDLTVSSMSRAEMVALVKFGRNAMTPFRHILSPEEIDAVVDYVRTMKAAE